MVQSPFPFTPSGSAYSPAAAYPIGQQPTISQAMVATQAQKSPAEKGLEELYHAMRNPDPIYQKALGIVVGKLKTSPLKDQILYTLAFDTDREVRRYAVSNLTKFSSPEFQRRVAERLSNDPEVELREALAGKLPMVPPALWKDQIILKLVQDPDWHVRTQAAKKVIDIQNNALRNTALNATLSDSNPYTRSALAAALGNCENELLRTQLVNQLRQDPNADVRSTATWSGIKAMTPSAQKDRWIEILFNSPGADANLTGKAIDLTLEHANPKLHPYVISQILDDPHSDHSLKLDAAQSTLKAKDEGFKQKIITKLLQSPDFQLRTAALELAESFDNTDALMTIIPVLMQDPENLVKEQTAQAIINMDNIALKMKLIEQYANLNNSEVRSILARGANKLPPSEMTDRLLQHFLADSNEYVRHNIDVINISNPVIRDAEIIKLANSTYMMDRNDAAQSIGGLSNPSLQWQLTEQLLYDSHPGTQAQLALSVKNNLSDEALKEYIIQALLKTNDFYTHNQVSNAVYALKNKALAESMLKQIWTSGNTHSKETVLNVRLRHAIEQLNLAFDTDPVNQQYTKPQLQLTA